MLTASKSLQWTRSHGTAQMLDLVTWDASPSTVVGTEDRL